IDIDNKEMTHSELEDALGKVDEYINGDKIPEISDKDAELFLDPETISHNRSMVDKMMGY
ncbi:unnamed protein product, partial [marine sediment metagenome]